MDDRPVQLTDDEYEHIEETIARSAKGRAFLRRYSRWVHGGVADDMRRILDQMRAVLHVHQGDAQAAQHVAVLRRELLEMAASIEQARREVAALRPPDGDTDKFLSATNELDAIVSSTERASFDILNSAERLMDLSGRLRRAGADAELCSDIEMEVTNIFTACSFQDLTGQRTSKVINALRYIEQRINAMMAIWDSDGVPMPPPPEPPRREHSDAHLLHGPSLPGEGVSQDDVDALFSTMMPEPAPGPIAEDSGWDAAGWGLDAADEPQPEPEPEPEPEPPPPPVAKTRKAKPAKAEKADPPPAPESAPAAAAPSASTSPLDQSAIDALFG